VTPLERALHDTERRNAEFQEEQRAYREGREDSPLAWLAYATGRTDDPPADHPMPTGDVMTVDGQPVNLRSVFFRPPY
jgi:hypothetical protein